MSLISRVLLAVALMTVACGISFAQVTTGTPPFGTVDAASGSDAIDLANLNAHIAIPVLHKSGRGTAFTYDVSYDSSVWYPVTSGSTKSWQLVYNNGWRAVTEASTGYISYFYTQQNAYPCFTGTYSNWTYHDAWGTSHYFAAFATSNWGKPGFGCGNGFSGFGPTIASDGSGYTLTVGSNNSGTTMGPVSFVGRDGKVISAPVGAGSGSGNFFDRNGNEISIDGSGNFYDTLNGTVRVLTVAAPAPPSSATFTYTAPSGANASYTMKYGSYTVQTNFQCGQVVDMGATPKYLVSEIDLPDGKKYLFTYEPTYQRSGSVTGRLASVTLPTGGSITYSYGHACPN